LSFFDEDDEPTSTTRTRVRPSPRRGSPAGGGSNAGQTVLVRRMVAVIVGAVLLLMLFFLISACNTTRQRNALKDYNRLVSGIATQSRQTGSEFFKLFEEGGSQAPQDLYAQILGLRGSADTALKQAQDIDPPDDMQSAHQSLLIALELRRDGLTKVAEQIRPALGDEGESADAAIEDIAGQMRAFDASDVLYEARVIPFIRAGFDNAEVGGQDIESSRFLADVSWIAPTYVAQRLGQQLSTGGDGGRGGGDGEGETTGPGLHGSGLDATSYGDVTLQPGTSNRLVYVPGQPFTVAFTNQGDNDEFNVKVTLRIASESGDPLTINKTVARVAKGEKATVTLPLNRDPPLDTVVTITVTVAAVPGEEKTDNNKAEYPSLFVRG
jgi:hypothetical protein